MLPYQVLEYYKEEDEFIMLKKLIKKVTAQFKKIAEPNPKLFLGLDHEIMGRIPTIDYQKITNKLNQKTKSEDLEFTENRSPVKNSK